MDSVDSPTFEIVMLYSLTHEYVLLYVYNNVYGSYYEPMYCCIIQ